MDFEDMFKLVTTFIALTVTIQVLQGDGTTESNIIQTTVDLIINVFPFVIGTGLILLALGYAIEQYEFEPTEFKIKIKFWEWSLSQYLGFTVGTIVFASLMNKAFGFVVSLILLVIAVFLRIPYEYKKMMRDA